MNKLCVGFFLGVFLKDHFLNVSLNIIKKGLGKYYSITNKKPEKETRVIKKIELVIKIKNAQYFKDLYPQENCETGVYRYTFPDQIIEYLNSNILNIEIDIKGLCDLNYQHNFEYEILSQIGDIYLYVNYNNFINVYTPKMKILSSDFVTNETHPFFKNIICCTLYYNSKIEYITKYIKKFSNQQNLELTTETVLLNYNIPTELLNCKVSILETSGIIMEYSITDKLI
jgi:hypothetical protein